MSFAEINGVRLFFTDEGEGEPTVVLVHGWTCDSNDWAWQLGALRERHRVIAADNRGHGRSSAPSAGYTIGQMADDVVALMRSRRVERFVVVGHSLGAAIALAIASTVPDAVVGVVTIDQAFVTDEALPGFMALVDDIDADPSLEVARAFVSESLYGPASADFLKEWHGRRLAGTPHHVVAACIRSSVEAPDGYIAASRGHSLLDRIGCPILALRADPAGLRDDAEHLRHEYSQAMAFAGAGHWLHQERAREVNATLLSWIDGLPGLVAIGN